MGARSTLCRVLHQFQSLTRFSPRVSVVLEGDPEKQHTYTTYEWVKGKAIVTVDVETPFDAIRISFEGVATTSTERATYSLRTAIATQTFLRLIQPIASSQYPTPRVLRPGHHYEFPFSFVIPPAVSPQSCDHDIKSTHVQLAHQMLPPTVNDPRLRYDDRCPRDEQVPGSCRIAYSVRVVLKGRSSRSSKMANLVDYQRGVRVMPLAEPMYCLGGDILRPGIYTRTEQSLTYGTAIDRSGQVVVTSHTLPVLLSYSSEGTAGKVQLNLRFNPIGNASPPHLKRVVATLQSTTFYSTTPWEDYPSLTDRGLANGWEREACIESFPIVSSHKGPLAWVAHSRYGSTSTRNSSISLSEDIYYTACIALDVALPPEQTYLPTFHSCLISRTYNLNLCLSYRTPATNNSLPNTTCHIPVRLLYTRNEPSMISSQATPDPLGVDFDDTKFEYQQQLTQLPAYSDVIAGLI
ncbi:uncharacterized protein BDW43DRAFT_310116 [Aspergillus alliaceus]|uniref:uncharacterized protein n=1 Tax=Petromyces alliaceus TaxID=209559 RepID=UPI0012A569A7|nr:uncharacterized protein BDW43DRAFT_310116 [Aspergillus alliaceus]KAB8234448.1 hypothetical protein BDW43DRAFT_310116 [Aspergillus alliaceus]